MKILHMTLHRIWFDQILNGEKKEEYRQIKDYWVKRLAKDYDVICFKNGYSKDAREITIEYNGYKIKHIWHPFTRKIETVFAIRLGRIIKTKNIV